MDPSTPSPVQPVDSQPMEFKDFSGGMTDYYLDCPLNRCRSSDNLLIVKQGTIGKLLTRPGSQLYDSTYYQIPSAARIGTLKNFSPSLFYHSARSFYYVASSDAGGGGPGWIELVGPTGNKVFPTGVTTTTVVSTATWNNHLFVTNSDFSRLQKIYRTSTGIWQLRTAGMPALATSPVVTAGAAGAGSYLYRFVYSYTYTVGTNVFTDRGPATEVAVINAAAPNATSIGITAIPSITNTTVSNYDTAGGVIRIEVYRTTNGGSNFFFVGSAGNTVGPTTYSDSISDAILLNSEPLYTEGGAPDNTQPPLCKFVFIVGDRAFYLNTKEGSVLYPNRVYQAVPGDPDSVPATFFHDCKDTLVAGGSVREVPVVFGVTDVYRLDNGIDELGRGDITPVTISVSAGCVSSLSVVQTDDGIFWAGNDGFYFTDGFQVLRVSDSLEQTTYPKIVATDERKRRIVGKYDPKKKRIWWAVQLAGTATDCDACLVLDLNWGLSTDMPFTTVSGAGGAHFAPSAIEFIGGSLIRGDKRGYTFKHLDTLYVDPKVDTSVVPSLWNDATILYNYISAATDFGTSFARKWVTRCGVVCKDETSLSLQITSINDDGRKTANLSPIRFRGNVTWGDPDVYWGDPTLVWNLSRLVDEARRFPAQGLRCEYKQIQLSNAKVAVINSDTLGLATVDTAAQTATLTGSYNWPSGAVDYYLAFSSDSYVKEYLVTARTATVLTFINTASLAPSGSVAWVLRGYPKGEVLSLLSYTLHYAILGKTQAQFRANATGEVGSS